jgi:PPM family protein phosphatase
MTNPTAPETRKDAPEAEEPAAKAAEADTKSKAKPDGKAEASADAKPEQKADAKPDEAKADAKKADEPPVDDKKADEPKAEEKPAVEEKPGAAEAKADVETDASEAKTEEPPKVEAKAEAAPKVEEPPKAKARPEVKIRLFGRTDVGQVREHNEDNFIVADLTKESRGLMETDRLQLVGDRGTLLGVCDGMGGAAAGEVASQLAVDIIYQRMAIGDAPLDHDDLAARLVHAIEAAGLRIFSEAKLDRTRRGMGTTATIASLLDDHLFLGQVGDSRAYILRGERLVQVTRDQSLVNQLIEAGQLTEEEAETFEHNNIILQALGTADSVQVDLTYVLLRKGDTLMLCSDGLSGMVRNDEIREVLRSVEDPLDACKTLTDRANQAGGHDNITVVVAKFEGAGLLEPTREDIDGLRYAKYPLPEPPSNSAQTMPEPSRKLKGLDQSKVSSRPPPKGWTGGGSPDIEVNETGDDYDDSLPVPRHPDDPIHIPTEGAPQWLVIMMIASAVACVTIAGYYLLR